MRAQRRAEQVMRGMNVGHPIAHGFADGVLQRPAAAGDAHHFRAQQPHAEDIQALPPHVLFAHVDDAFQAEQRADRRRRHAVLAGAGFGDDALLAHAPREQRLAQAVVDLVRAGVQQVLALDVDLRAAVHFAQALGVVERRRAAGVIGQQIFQLGLKRRIVPRFEIRLLQFFERRHQNFGNVAAAVGSEMSGGIGLRRRHDAESAAFTNLRIFSWSFRPGDFSMREQASTPQGWACSMAVADIVGIQAAGDDDLLVEMRGLASSPRSCRCRRRCRPTGVVDEQRLDVLGALPSDPRAGGIACQIRTPRGFEMPVKLRDIQPGVEHDLRDGFRRFVHEHAHLPHVRRDLFADHGRAGVRNVSRAFAIEIESNGRSSGLDGCQGIFAIGDPADLHHHASSASQRAPPDRRISSDARPPGTPDSPPRAGARTSAEEWMPLSATRTTPAGIFSARRSDSFELTLRTCAGCGC